MYFLKLFVLFSLIFFTSCDDGDIIQTDFEFEADDLDFCYSEESDETVFYNYNSDNNEVIYLIIPEEFNGVEEFDNDNDDTVGDSYIVQYLKFESSINADDYFCTAVASIETIERELNGTEGTISIVTINTVNLSEDEDDDADEDGDGIPNFRELFIDEATRSEYEEDIDIEGFIDFAVIDNEDIKDSDGDGIPDFRDEDDDNDNVSTATELYPKDINDEDEDGSITDDVIEEDEDGNPIYLDTDGDGALDYLDEDDDGDGALTRLEFDGEGNTSPIANTNDDGLALYLDPDIAIEAIQVEDIETLSNYDTSFESIIRILNLTLSDSDSNITSDVRIIGELNEETTPQFKVYLRSDGTFETVEIDGETSIETTLLISTIGLVTDEVIVEETTP